MKFMWVRGNRLALMVFVISFTSLVKLQAQQDSLVFSGKNVITGEIKRMVKGALEISTSYDDSNFKIKWLDVQEIYTISKFVISTGTTTYEGRLATISNNRVKIFTKDSTLTTCKLSDIVYLRQFKDGFRNRFDVWVEFGFNFTKAQNLRQFSARNSLSYKTNKSTLDLAYNFIRSAQTGTETVKRSDGLLNYNRIVFRDWYVTLSLSTLSNSEQKIDRRANTQLGIGNYLYNTNKAYWGVSLGLNKNLEKFENQSGTRNSWEAALGTELNLYDIEDINLSLIFMGYTGLTDTSRYRADLTFDVKYDLPLDFFIRTGITLNYDNRPALDASTSDYVIRSGLGWEF